ncbi:MAG: UDP-N-acetylmuramoyl-L-alanyl-D-glutamate--2,6-diaminopimelate ligase [Gordonia sp. (in: high G+C Gram-positive bacteria)]
MAQDSQDGPLRPQTPFSTQLDDLARLSGARLDGAPGAVAGVTLRAQDAYDGYLFAALPGTRTHGARYAGQAAAAGATAVLTDDAGLALIRDDAATAGLPVLVHDDPRSVLGNISARIYGDPSSRMTLIGITGTSGKTTTSYLAEAALRAAGRTVGLVGTVEVRIDGQRVPTSLTTPEAPDLQRLFAVMVERGVDAVVMEVSSHALALGRVDGCHFAVGGFTNLSRDHLDYHHSMDEYFEAKARLFAPGSPNRAGQAVICVDDRWGEQMAEVARSGAEAVATVSTTGDGAWSVVGEVGVDGGSQTVVISDPEEAEHVMTVPLPGAYNVANALLAVGLTATAGVPVATAVAGLGQVAVPGRLEKVDVGQDFLAVVDYAHKPAAVEAVLATLAAQTDGRLIVVLGAGGDRDAEKRPLMGAAAARGADLVVVTDDNPRTEDPATIRAAVLAGANGVPAGDRRAAEIREQGDRHAAITEAVDAAQAGDVVLIAGKGHETGQEINGHKTPFDDRQVLAEALAGRDDASSLTVFAAGPGSTVSQVRGLLREMVAAATDAGAGSAHRTGDASSRRTWAILGELADDEGLDQNERCVAHDLLGRQAVRLAVDKVIAVGEPRTVRALHQGAVMEGSWGDEAALFAGPAEVVEQFRAKPQEAPAAGDVVLVASDGPLAEALTAFWRDELGLLVKAATR